MSDVILNDEIQEAFNKLTRGTDDFNVLVVEFADDHVTCDLVHASGDGFEAVKDTIDEDVIMYAVLRIRCVDIVQTRDRFVFLTWNAPGADKMDRGKIVFQQKQILDKFADVPMFSIEIDGSDKLTESNIAKVLNENLGSDRPDYYEFGPDDIVELFEDQLNHMTGEMAALFTQKRSESASKSVRLTENKMSMDDQISGAWDSLINSKTNFMVLGLSDDNFKLIGTGSTGFDDMLTHFDSSGIFFCVLRVQLIDVVRNTNKFVFITYMGEKVPMVQTARVGFQQQKAKDLLKGVNLLNYEVADTASFKQKDIAQYLLTNAGGDMPEKFKFGPNDYVRVQEDQLIHERTEGDDDDVEEKKEASGLISGGIGGAASIDEAWNKVLTETDGYNFLIVAIKQEKKGHKRRGSNWLENSMDDLELIGTGAGGFETMRSLFDAKRIMFAVLRIPAIDVVGHRNRFVFLVYIGDNTTPKEKSRVVFQSDATKKIFTGVTLKEYQIPDNESFSQIDVASEVDRSSGAGDRPDRYQFGPNDFVLVEGDKFVHSTDASGRVQPKKKSKVSASKSDAGSVQSSTATSGAPKSYQVKAWKEERVKLKGERSNLQRKLKNVEKRLSELDELISGGS